MRLPGINQLSKKRIKTTKFLGLNLTANTAEGEFTDTIGLTTDNYPWLTQRKSRESLLGHTNPTQVYEWDGKLIIIEGNMLYYDGEPICNVSEGEKQFAVVNTKLVVFPDKITIDLTNNTYEQMAVDVNSVISTDGTSATNNSITLIPIPRIASNISAGTYAGSVDSWTPALYTYGTDREAVAECYHDGAWDFTMLNPLRSWSGIFGGYSPTSRRLEVGDIIIPKVTTTTRPGGETIKSYGFVMADAKKGLRPDTTQYNTEGYYAVLSSQDGWVGVDDSHLENYIDVYDAKIDAITLNDIFKEGDSVDISGSPYKLLDKEKLIIKGINAETNTLTFEDDTFNVPLYTYEFSSAWNAQTSHDFRLMKDSANYRIALGRDQAIREGSKVLFIYGSSTTPETWKIVNKENMKEIASGTLSTASDYDFTVTSYNSSLSAVSISIKRIIPDLDFICESNNRLWGVSNADKTIYASALGYPNRFFTYAGVDTDSYAVAVGSEGDFTAIHSYGSAVCCWKEKTLHKVLGSYPSEYYMNEYNVAGVKEGCHNSIAHINEVVYYEGIDGFYSFTGTIPRLISIGLMGHTYSNGVGGTDGRNYYISVNEGEDARLFVYDTLKGLWIKEDNISVKSFTRVETDLYMLVDNVIYKVGYGNEVINWLAELVAYVEDEHMKKMFTKFILRFEMEKGSTIKVEVKIDNAPWRTVFERGAVTSKINQTVPIKANRCDEIKIRLSGKGRTTVKSLAREFINGSEDD